jgi:hypothetical protein
LTTGRVLEQWHTGTMTDRMTELAKTSGSAKFELNEQDAYELKIAAGGTVEVASKYGAIPWHSPRNRWAAAWRGVCIILGRAPAGQLSVLEEKIVGRTSALVPPLSPAPY